MEGEVDVKCFIYLFIFLEDCFLHSFTFTDMGQEI